MEIDNKNIVTQEETGEPAAIDAVEARVEKEIAELTDEARKSVKEGLELDETSE